MAIEAEKGSTHIACSQSSHDEVDDIGSGSAVVVAALLCRGARRALVACATFFLLELILGALGYSDFRRWEPEIK